MERKQHRWLLIAVILIALPPLYVASFIPLVYASKYGKLGNDAFLTRYAYPLTYLYEKGPSWIREPLKHYDRFLGRL